MCMFCVRISQLLVSQLLVCDGQHCADLKNARDKESCVYVHVLCTYISISCVSTACLRWPSLCRKTPGIRNHVFMYMFCVRISQLLVSQLLVCHGQNCADHKNDRDKESCVYVHVLCTYISTQLIVCDGHDGPVPG